MTAARETTSNIAGLMLAKVLRAPLWLLISAVLARVLEPEGLGIWSMILAAAAILNQLLLQWTQSITQRFGRTEWLASGRLARTWAMRWPSLCAGMTLVLLLLVLEPFDWALRFYGLSGNLRWFIFPALLTIWLMAEVQGLQQVRERFAALALSPIVADLTLLAVIGLLVVIKHAGGGPDLNLTLSCLTATGVVTWLLWLAVVLGRGRFAWQRPERGQWRRALLFAAPLIPGFLIGYLAEWCDYFLIHRYYSAYEVGLFHPAYQYLLIMVGLPTALATVLIPQIVAKTGGDGGAAVLQLVRQGAARYTVVWSALVLPVVALLPEIFAWLLGDRYRGSVPLLQVLLVAAPGAVVQHTYGIAYFVQGRLAISTAALFGLKCIVNIAVSLMLLPTLGVMGSAIGSAVSYLVLQWLFVFDQHRHLGLRHGTGALVLFAAQAAAVALAMVDGAGLRLVAATSASLSMLVLARRSALFSPEDIAAMLPRFLARLEEPCCRLLCRRY